METERHGCFFSLRWMNLSVYCAGIFPIKTSFPLISLEQRSTAKDCHSVTEVLFWSSSPGQQHLRGTYKLTFGKSDHDTQPQDNPHSSHTHSDNVQAQFSIIYFQKMEESREVFSIHDWHWLILFFRRLWVMPQELQLFHCLLWRSLAGHSDQLRGWEVGPPH